MKNENKFVNYHGYYLVLAALFIAIFAICTTLFYFIAYESSGTFLNFARAASYIAALAAAVSICARCAKSNRINNPDIFTPPRNLAYYIKRMGFAAATIILANLAISILGGFAVGLFGGFMFNMESLFARELIFKLPAFAIYLVIVYKFFVGYGFKDCHKKIYNPHFKIFTAIIAFFIFLPGAIYDNFFCIDSTNIIYLNVQTVFGPNSGIYFVDNEGYAALNEEFSGFSVFLIALTLVLAFAVQLAVAWIAYKRGKKLFVKERIRKSDDDQIDENI